MTTANGPSAWLPSSTERVRPPLSRLHIPAASRQFPHSRGCIYMSQLPGEVTRARTAGHHLPGCEKLHASKASLVCMQVPMLCAGWRADVQALRRSYCLTLPRRCLSVHASRRYCVLRYCIIAAPQPSIRDAVAPRCQLCYCRFGCKLLALVRMGLHCCSSELTAYERHTAFGALRCGQ